MAGSDGRVLLVSRVRHAGLKSQLPRQPSRYPNTKGAERVSFGRPTCVYLKGSYPLAPSMPRGYYYDQIPCLVCALMSAVAPPDFKARDQRGHSQFYRETEHINHSCLEFSLTSVVWTFHTFDDYKKSMISQNIWRRFFGFLPMNTSPSSLFLRVLPLERFYWNS